MTSMLDTDAHAGELNEIEIVPAESGHLQELSQLCHLAFNTLHERHRIPADVPTPEVGALIIGSVLQRPDYVGAVAMQGGKAIGLNFVLFADEVCGLGPIAVLPGVQTRGVGRMLMEWGIAEARQRRGAGVRVRLFQEAVNTTSLSLYTRVGFHWRDAAAMMLPRPEACTDGTCRAMVDADLDAVDALCVAHHGGSRKNDVVQLLALGLSAFVLERDGQVIAYHVSTLFGHGAGQTQADLLTLIQHMASQVEESMSVVLVPLSQAGLFGQALQRGFQTRKVVNEMSLHHESAAMGPCCPSIQG